MEAVVAGWASRAEELRERWFRGGPYSRLWLGRVRAHRSGGEVRFHWTYMWSDMGMCNVLRKRVRIMQVARNRYVVNRRVLCDLDGLENACFGGVWDECRGRALEELRVLGV